MRPKSRFIELTLTGSDAVNVEAESVLLAADKIASILPKAYGALVSTIEGSGASYMVKETPEEVLALAEWLDHAEVVEAIRREMLRRFSHILSMEQILDCAYALADSIGFASERAARA